MNIAIPCKLIHPDNQLASYQAAVNENPHNERPTLTAGRSKRSIGSWQKFWGHGRVLTISFMENLPVNLKQRIEKLIRQWEPATNLTFKFDDGQAGEIRISTTDDVSNSYLGTDALLVPSDLPTLRLGIDPDHVEFDLTVLHEFGHALGMQHEHQHPSANIPWDVPKVYEYYNRHFQWTVEDVDKNIFNTLDVSTSLKGPYDKSSIMHYEIPNELTLGNWEVGVNTKISKLDRRNMRKAYPKL
ncbi:M12 family metallopeptidase [Pseudomonas sp. H1h]|uniref:M12 family metallopeptidase n=1 Tax=Pseudomonas sp. H1h TaxID=1397280 RepID=UPI0004680260|nr:M12 family metallopeptidase [Pseudomonas sp. H1h]